MFKKKKGTMKYLFSEDIQFVRGQKSHQQHMRTVAAVLALVLLVALSAGTFVVIDSIYCDMFGRAEAPDYTVYQTYEGDFADEYGRREVEFYSGENLLKGWLYGASNKSKGLVVISHGLGGGADSYLQEAIYFVKRGYQVFSFNNTGSHDSEGEGTMSLSQSVMDLDAALDYIEAQEDLGKLPILLFGHSWGGYAVTSVLNYDHKITAAASVAGYNTPMEMMMQWMEPNMGLVRYPVYPYLAVYQKVRFGAASNLSAVKGINNVDIPVLIIHGAEDELIYADGASIMAHRSEVTNPEAIFLLWEEGNCGHSDLFFTREATEAAAAAEEELELLKDTYGGEENIPEDVLRQWVDSIDRKQTSQLDPMFMENIYAFFEKVIS